MREELEDIVVELLTTDLAAKLTAYEYNFLSSFEYVELTRLREKLLLGIHARVKR